MGQRQLDQDYEFKELAERQKLQLRNKAIKKGLDPESFTQKHPPTIHMFSKYERRRRSKYNRCSTTTRSLNSAGCCNKHSIWVIASIPSKPSLFNLPLVSTSNKRSLAKVTSASQDSFCIKMRTPQK